MNVEEQVKRFQDFFDGTKEYKKIIAGDKKKFIEVDFKLLSRFDPEIADLLLEDPEDTIKAAELAAEQIGDGEGDLQILFKNLPNSTNLPLNEISDQLGKFLSFDGYIIKPSDIYLKAKSAKYECSQCGNVISILMLGNIWRSPSTCGCGSKKNFRLISKELAKFQRLEILEATDSVPDKPRRLIKKKLFIEANLTRKDLNHQLQPGQRVKVAGFLELEELRTKNSRAQSNEFRVNIIANNITPIENSWDALKLSLSQLKKVKEMAKKKGLLEGFAQSLAPSFEGYNIVRESLILQHVGGKRIFDTNGNLEERECIHILMVGGYGTGKTYLMRRSMVISPLWIWAQGSGLTKVGLVASIIKDEYGAPTLEVGPLVMADKGILGLEEMDKMEKGDFGILTNPMAEEVAKINKWNIDRTLTTRTAILSTSNPIHKRFVDNESIMNQLAPIPKEITDRYDVIWPMREKIDEDKLEDKYLARHIDKSEDIKQEWSNDEMRDYITYARKLIPIVKKETAEYFKEKFKKLTGKTKTEEGEEDEKSHRLRGNIFRWIYAHTKFIGVGKEGKDKKIDITKESVDFAFGLMRHSFELLKLIDDKGFVKYEDLEDIPNKKEINKYYLVKEVVKKLSQETNNLTPGDRIIEEAKKINKDFTEDDFEKEITKLKKMGDVFEPRNGFWAVI